MLKKTVEFENIDGQKVTKNFYFHLSQTELIKANVADTGIKEDILTIQNAETMMERIEALERIVRMAVGEKTAEGNFKKNDRIREDFMDSGAWDAFFMEMIQNASLCAEFIRGVMPPSLLAKVDPKELAKIDVLVEEHKALMEGKRLKTENVSLGFDVESKTVAADGMTITNVNPIDSPVDPYLLAREETKQQNASMRMDLDPKKTWDQYTTAELVAMPKSHFEWLAPDKNVTLWPKEYLVAAMQRKTTE